MYLEDRSEYVQNYKLHRMTAIACQRTRRYVQFAFSCFMYKLAATLVDSIKINVHST